MKLLAMTLLFPMMAFAASSPETIRAGLHHYGAKNFADKVSPDDWQTLLDNISSGKSEWLALAPKVAPVINQHQANQLTDALYYALAPNAKEALKTLSELDKHHDRYQQGTALSCVFPLDKPEAQTLSVYNDTRLSLLNAGPQAAECLWILEGWLEETKAEKAKNTQK